MKSLYITYMSLSEPLSYSQSLAYLKGIAKNGISIHILSFEKTKFATGDYVNKIKQDLMALNIKWFFLRYHKRPQFLAKIWDIACGMTAAFFISIKERIDVIHPRNTICAFIGVLPILLLRKKLLFDIRGFMAEEYLDANLWRKESLVYKTVRNLERYFIKKADRSIVLTEKAKRFLSDNYSEENISVIPACVDMGVFQYKDGRNAVKPAHILDKFAIIYTGSLGTWYMLDEMMDFFKALMYYRNSKAIFLILSQTERDVIEKGIPKGLINDVIIENTEPMHVPDFLNMADAGISFIKPCFSKISSSPTKFAEYLACGLPVVINKGIGDTEEIVRDNKVGVIIQGFSEQDYKTGAYELNELLKEGIVLRKRCREVAERYFSLEYGIKKYLEVYAGLYK